MLLRSFGIGVMATAAVWGQEVVSARAGLIHYIEGKVTVEGKVVEPLPATKLFSQFPEVKENQTLAAAEGRAEVLLSPGVVLRVGEDSSIRMLSSKLSDSRVEVVSGTAVVDVSDLLKENVVTLIVAGVEVQPKKPGMYRFQASPAEVRVFEGQADIAATPKRIPVKRGQAVTLDGQFATTKFDPERGDSLLRWSLRRAGYLAMANVSAAKSLADNDTGWSTGGWLWNPFYSMYTFIPSRGVVCNPYMRMCFYSPQRVYAVYYRPQPMPSANAGWNGGNGVSYGGYNPNYGYTTATGRGYDGYSSTASVSAGAPAASAPVADSGGARGAESSAGRGGDGGRGQ